MPGRGVLFALDRGDEAELLSLVDAKARVAFVANEIEERWETSWLLDMDDTWLPVHYCLNGAIGYPLPGAAPEANAIFDRLELLTPAKAYAPYGRAVAAAATGNSDEAVKWLTAALDRGIDDLGQVERDESFRALKDLPKFAELIATARARVPPK